MAIRVLVLACNLHRLGHHNITPTAQRCTTFLWGGNCDFGIAENDRAKSLDILETVAVSVVIKLAA
jgi:hypothetical protein